jgi:DNA-binding LacI/PurR family transcriptional regulator
VNAKRPTTARTQMADLARLAGVSASTVSRALSGNPAIALATRERITELARSLNYQVNAGAANLRKRTNTTIGVILLNDNMQAMSDPFILKLLGHIADQLDQRGMALLLRRAPPNDPGSMAAMVDSGQAGGLIVIGQNSQNQDLNAMFSRGIPMMVWGAKVPDSAYPVVGSDNEQGAYIATRHLVEQGCRRIAYMGEYEHAEAHLRHQGYLRALTEAGLNASKELHIHSTFDSRGARAQFAQWLHLGHDFDGVFCISDVAALSAIAELTERGIAVPKSVKLVGYDNIDIGAYLHPTLSTINQPTDLAARLLVEGVMSLMQTGSAVSQCLPTDLVCRESSLR